MVSLSNHTLILRQAQDEAIFFVTRGFTYELLRTGFITIFCRPGWLFCPPASFPSLAIALWAMTRSGALLEAKIAAPGLKDSYETGSSNSPGYRLR